jgi:hypothetical protein
VAEVLVLGAERERADVRVQAVSAHHRVEPARPAAFEGDVHVVVLGQAGDGVVERVLDVASLQEAHEGLGRMFHDVSGPQAVRSGRSTRRC